MEFLFYYEVEVGEVCDFKFEGWIRGFNLDI